jgi:acid phosphatase type 7
MKKYCLQVLVGVTFIFGMILVPDRAFSATDKYRLVWNDDPETTISIGWDQISGKDPVVCYGTEDFGNDWKKYPHQQKPTRKLKYYQSMNTQFADLKGLMPNQNYYFVIKDNESMSKRYWFKTAPDTPQAFTFIAGGDTKSSGEAYKAGRLSTQMVAKLRPLFVIFNGDFCSGDGTNNEYWKTWLNDWSTLTTTNDGRMIPIIPVHGNHENGNKSVLNKLFNVPYQYNDDRNIYYSLSFGGSFFHMIALNSDLDTGGEQKSWLENDLMRHKNFTFKIAGYHKPFYPHTQGKSEKDQQYKNWANLFHKYGLDISMDGDSHMSKITFPVIPSNEQGSYQGFIRDDGNGTMYVGEGSWGASPRANNDDKPWTIKSARCNQIKWFHAYPAVKDSPAHIDIRTVITATRNENDQVVSHVDNVKALSEEDVFKVPANIDLVDNGPYGTVITYPFKDIK